MDGQDAERVAERAAEALGPEAGLVASLDPVSLARAMAEVGAGLARHPWGGALAGIRFAAGLAVTGAVSAARMLGAESLSRTLGDAFGVLWVHSVITMTSSRVLRQLGPETRRGPGMGLVMPGDPAGGLRSEPGQLLTLLAVLVPCSSSFS